MCCNVLRSHPPNTPQVLYRALNGCGPQPLRASLLSLLNPWGPVWGRIRCGGVFVGLVGRGRNLVLPSGHPHGTSLTDRLAD